MAEKWVDQPLALPKDPGAYLLWIRLKRAVRIPSHLGEKIGPALLLYAGSAYGPGGIRAHVPQKVGRSQYRADCTKVSWALRNTH